MCERRAEQDKCLESSEKESLPQLVVLVGILFTRTVRLHQIPPTTSTEISVAGVSVCVCVCVCVLHRKGLSAAFCLVINSPNCISENAKHTHTDTSLKSVV